MSAPINSFLTVTNSQRGSSQQLVWGQQGHPSEPSRCLTLLWLTFWLRPGVIWRRGHRPFLETGLKERRWRGRQQRRLVRLTFQSRRKRQSLRFISVCGGGGPSVHGLQRSGDQTGTGSVSRGLRVTFSLAPIHFSGKGAGGGGSTEWDKGSGRGNRHPKSLRTKAKKTMSP